MATSARTKRAMANGTRVPLEAGPWPGVHATNDPYDAASVGYLAMFRNGYVPDPKNRSGAYSRPGFSQMFNGAAVFTSATAFRGQVVYNHTNTDGSTVNFIAFAGHLFRIDPTFGLFVDVTPVGVTLDASVGTRLCMVSVTGQFIVSDGINTPWIGTALTATPITATKIDFDGLGSAWSARWMTQHQGCLVVALGQVNTVARRGEIAWSQPAQAGVGWQQTNFDNAWLLEENGTRAIEGVFGTNSVFYYWRNNSIGTILGDIGPNWQTSSDHDSMAYEVGTQSPQTIVGFGQSIFFVDQLGRPQLISSGSPPTDIWLSMRGIVDAATVGAQLVTAQTAVAAFVPTSNQYIVGVWSPQPGVMAPCVDLYVFDGKTGAFAGIWNVAGGISVEAMGKLVDANGHDTLVILGSQLPGGGLPLPATGFAWSLNTMLGTPVELETPDDADILTAPDGTILTVPGQPNVWLDGTMVPTITAMTQRLGFEEDVSWYADECIAITTSPAPIKFEVISSTGDVQVGIATPALSQDGTYRAVCGLDMSGRGFQVLITPQTASQQWGLHRVCVMALPTQASWEDA